MDDKPKPAEDVENKSDETVEPETDKVVEDIQKHDGDELLEVENPEPHLKTVVERVWYKKLWHKLASNKKVSIPAAAVTVLVILSIVPFTRYPIFGLFLKDNYTLAVWDSQTNQPVSAATVSIAGKTATTDNHGVAHLKVKVGHHVITITKKYYTSLSSKILVPLRSHSGDTPYTLVATGRQVPVTVTNKINGQPVDDAVVNAAGTTAHTDSTGKVIIVLPADKSTLSATISASNYNNASATIQVTTQAVKANDFQITPAGKVYFLSKLSGTIDVVKTNLDGTDRQTVLAGTGYEDDSNTVLLASRDWKYLALLSIRDTTGNPQINLIDTTNNDQVTNIDKGDATFTLVGWQGHDFVYDVVRNTVPITQNDHEALKSYDADSGKITILDQNTAVTDSTGDSAYSQFADFYLLSDQVFYTVGWVGDNTLFQGQNNAIRTVQPDGENLTNVKTFDATQTSGYFAVQYLAPNQLYVLVSDYGANDSFYEYSNGSLTTAPSTVTDNTFYNQSSSTYLLSPSGNQTFWSEERDGKNTLFVGDASGDNGKQIATLSPYDTYGWYTDNYLLVSQNSDELYIMPVAGGTPIQISDYHKPAVTYNGYGGGYGGL